MTMMSAVEFVILSNEYHFAVYEAVLFVLLFFYGIDFYGFYDFGHGL